MALQDSDLLIIGTAAGDVNKKITVANFKKEIGAEVALQFIDDNAPGRIGTMKPGPNLFYDATTGMVDINIEAGLVFKNVIVDNGSASNPTGDPDAPDPGDELGNFYIVESPVTLTTKNWGFPGTGFAVDSKGSGYHVSTGQVEFASLKDITDESIIVAMPSANATIEGGVLKGIGQITVDNTDPAYDALRAYPDATNFLLDFGPTESYQYDSNNPPIVQVLQGPDPNDPTATVISFVVIRPGRMSAGLGIADIEYTERLNLFNKANNERTNIYVHAVILNGEIDRIDKWNVSTAYNLQDTYLISGISGDIDDQYDKLGVAESSVTTNNEFTQVYTNDKVVLTQEGWKIFSDFAAANSLFEVAHATKDDPIQGPDVQVPITPALQIDNNSNTGGIKRAYLSINTVSQNEDGLMPSDWYDIVDNLPNEFSDVRDIEADIVSSPDYVINDLSLDNSAVQSVYINKVGFGDLKNYTIGVKSAREEARGGFSSVRVPGVTFYAFEEEIKDKALWFNDTTWGDTYNSCFVNVKTAENLYRYIDKNDYENGEAILSSVTITGGASKIQNVIDSDANVTYSLIIGEHQPLDTATHQYNYTVIVDDGSGVDMPVNITPTVGVDSDANPTVTVDLGAELPSLTTGYIELSVKVERVAITDVDTIIEEAVDTIQIYIR